MAVIIFFPGSAIAENHASYESGAGITPLNFFYFFDRFAEKIRAATIFDTKKKLEFAFSLLKERTEEVKAVRKDKGYDAYNSKEYEIARESQMEAVRDIGRRLSGLRDEEIQRFYKKLNEEAPKVQEHLRQDLFALSVKKKELREAINEARKAGDAVRAGSLLEELTTAKNRFDRLAKAADRSNIIIDIEVEKIEDDFEDNVKREIILEKAKKLKESLAYTIYDPEGEWASNPAAVQRLERIIEAIRHQRMEDRLAADYKKFLEGEEKRFKELEEKTKPPEEKELDRKLAQELAAKRSEELKQTMRQQARQTVPAQNQSTPRSLGQPDADTLGGPIKFNPLLNFQGKVGEKFEYSFCQPPATRASDLCPAASVNPTGGKPPYHFQLGSGGFPPFGIALNLNGLLSGAPSAEGSRTFSVCAIDLAGSNACRTIAFTVKPKAAGDKDACYAAYNAAYDICNRAYNLGGEEYGDYNTFNNCIGGAERKRDDCLCAARADYLCRSIQAPAPLPPETSGASCWVEREECHKKNDNDRVACYNSCPSGDAGTQCAFDCTIKSNAETDRCNAISCQ